MSKTDPTRPASPATSAREGQVTLQPAARPGPAESGKHVQRDQIFATPQPRVGDFHFGRETALVFDDMLLRSVPMYAEIQRMVACLTADFAAEGSNVYDLGCSTCTTFLNIDQYLPPERKVRFVGLDSSPEMLQRGRQKLEESGFTRPFDLEVADFNQGARVENASVALLVLTLQFVRPLHRDALLADIYRGMNENGCLILVEKVLGESSTFNRLFIEHYYDFKRANGYSDLEISQKREALENVLVPYRLEENRELLRRTGFRNVDVFFKWFNFCGVIALK
jgi:tRNA (cmo5U34)-methyltransferase